jgi:hypothetical protein
MSWREIGDNEFGHLNALALYHKPVPVRQTYIDKNGTCFGCIHASILKAANITTLEIESLPRPKRQF